MNERTARRHRYAAGWNPARRKVPVGRRLRFDTLPEPDESLIGLVARATGDHGLDSVNGVLRRASINMYRPGPLSLLPVEALTRLAPILGCPEQEIAVRTTPHAEAVPRAGPVRFGDAVLRPHDVEWDRRRIAPLTLRASPHHREAWLVRLLPYCPVSLERLVDGCPRCGSPLRWSHAWGIGVCETCVERDPEELERSKHLVEPSTDPLLDPALADGYRLFADLVASDRARHNAALYQLAPSVRSLDSVTLLDLVLSTGMCLAAGGPLAHRSEVAKIDPAVLAAVVARGALALVDWPVGLRAWARQRAEALIDDRAAFRMHREAVRRLGHRARVSPAQAELVREALPDMFGNIRRNFADPGAVMTVVDAGKHIPLEPHRVRDLFDRSLIDGRELPHDGRKAIQLRAAAVRRLKARLEGSRPRTALTALCGLPPYAAEQMCCLGLVERETEPAVDHLRGDWNLTTASIVGFERELRCRALPGTGPDMAVPLGTAARRIGGRMKPWGAIMRALLDGSMPFWLDPGRQCAGHWTRRIVVVPAEISRFDGIAFDPGPDPAVPLADTFLLLESREVLNLLGSQTVDPADIFDADIRSRDTIGPGKVVGRAVVLDHAMRVVSFAEIGARTGWNPQMLRHRLAPHSHLKRLGGWCREGVAELGLPGIR